MKRDLWGLGMQAVKVREGDMIMCPRTQQPYRVRWFNRARGFGFVEDLATHENVFLHLPTLELARRGFFRTG